MAKTLKTLTFNAQRDEITKENRNFILAELPDFVSDFIDFKSMRTSELTRYEYTLDIRQFLNYIHQNIDELKERNIKDLDIKCLELVTDKMLIHYMNYYLKNHTDSEGNYITNDESTTIRRKMSSISCLYKYAINTEKINKNPFKTIELPKRNKNKHIIKLEPDEAARFLENIENSNVGSKKQQAYNKNFVKRDMSLCLLLLSTGIRVSECCGLDITSVDMNKQTIVVKRKGGHIHELPFSDEAAAELKLYLEERKGIESIDGDNPLFLSSRRTRLSVDAIQNIVKKYANTLGLNKNITAHKLRATYGNTLYEETSDIYFVQEMLGHSSPDVTVNHYVEQNVEGKRGLARKLSFRNTSE